MRPQNSIYLNFKSNCLHRLLERGIIIPFHKKICSWCHSIPHAKVVKLDKTGAILETLKTFNWCRNGWKQRSWMGWTSSIQVHFRFCEFYQSRILLDFLNFCRFIISTFANDSRVIQACSWATSCKKVVQINNLQTSCPDQ